MLYHVALVRTDVSEELSSSIIRVTKIGELETMLATWHNIPEDGIHNHNNGTITSFIVKFMLYILITLLRLFLNILIK
jgi:hypothetical protein